MYSPNHSRPSVQQNKNERESKRRKRKGYAPTISPLAIFASLSSAWISAIASLMELCTTTSGADVVDAASSTNSFEEIEEEWNDNENYMSKVFKENIDPSVLAYLHLDEDDKLLLTN